jgi:hypothetical protein
MALTITMIIRRKKKNFAQKHKEAERSFRGGNLTVQ